MLAMWIINRLNEIVGFLDVLLPHAQKDSLHLLGKILRSFQLFIKGVSGLETCMEYFALLGRSCEDLNLPDNFS